MIPLPQHLERIAHAELDTSGLMCPLPLLKTKRALARLQVGQILRVIATDPAAELDLKVFAECDGHQLLSVQQEQSCYYFLLQKGG